MAAYAVRVIGPGRAGLSLAGGLEKAGWRVLDVFGRGDDPTHAAQDTDLVVIATPDPAIAAVAARIEPSATAVVAHLAGAVGLEVLAPHPRRGSLHPLRSLPATTSDLVGAWFAVAGDPFVAEVVDDLGGRAVTLDPAHRTAYHAAAVVASNHLVALMASVEQIAARAGVPLDAFVDLARGTLDNVAALGARGALTGPVARGDWPTVESHLAALPDSEREAYVALARAAARLAGRKAPDLTAPATRGGRP